MGRQPTNSPIELYSVGTKKQARHHEVPGKEMVQGSSYVALNMLYTNKVHNETTIVGVSLCVCARVSARACAW